MVLYFSGKLFKNYNPRIRKIVSNDLVDIIHKYTTKQNLRTIQKEEDLFGIYF